MKSMFIQRNYDRTECDDFTLNVLPMLNGGNEAVPVYDVNGVLIGWKIQTRHE